MNDSTDWARPIVHVELVARDLDRQRTFYREMFHWNIDPSEGAFIASFDAGLGAPIGGPAGHIRSGDQPGFTVYIQVRNLAESLAKAVVLGGTVVLERLDVPGGPTLAAITDPEGNSLTLVQQ
jgi:uncharacterized protein